MQESNETTYIYALVDPRDKAIRYVGKSNMPQKRLNAHLRDGHNKGHKAYWVKQLVSEGYSPKLIILEEVKQSNWIERERLWISLLRSNGLNLVNDTDGGEGLENPSEETRRKISNANKGNHYALGAIRSEETRKKLSISRKGKPTSLGYKSSKETRAKLSEWHRGRKLSDETRAKMSASSIGNKNSLGYKHSDETREKVRIAATGRKHTEETKARMSIAQKGRKMSDETIKKMSDAKKGKKMSDEAKKKNSEAHKGEKNNFFGKKHSESTKAKISETKKLRLAQKKATLLSAEQDCDIIIPKEK